MTVERDRGQTAAQARGYVLAAHGVGGDERVHERAVRLAGQLEALHQLAHHVLGVRTAPPLPAMSSLPPFS